MGPMTDDDLLGLPETTKATSRQHQNRGPDMIKVLPNREEQFVQDYFRTGNAYRSFIATFPDVEATPATLRGRARDMKNRKRIQLRLKELQEELSREVMIDTARIVRQLTKIAMFDPRNMFDEHGRPLEMHELDDDTASAIGSFDIEPYTAKIEGSDADGEEAKYQTRYRITKVKPSDKRAALVDIGKHLGMFTERVEHTGKDGKDLMPKEVTDASIARRVAFLLTTQAIKK